MKWTTWGVILLLGGLGAGPARAGLFDGCHDNYRNCVDPGYGYGCYAPMQPYYAPAGCGTMCQQPYAYCAPCDDRGCLERMVDKAWELETRKNQWLMKTFLGCDDDCNEYAPGCAAPAYYPGTYYGYPAAPGCNCN